MKTLFHTINGISSKYIYQSNDINTLQTSVKFDIESAKEYYNNKRAEKGYEILDKFSEFFPSLWNDGKTTVEKIIDAGGDALTTTKDTLINKAKRLTAAEEMAYQFLSGFGTNEAGTSIFGQFFNWLYSFVVADSPIGAAFYMAMYRIPSVQKMLDKAASENGSLDELRAFQNYFGSNMNKVGKKQFNFNEARDKWMAFRTTFITNHEERNKNRADAEQEAKIRGYLGANESYLDSAKGYAQKAIDMNNKVKNAVTNNG